MQKQVRCLQVAVDVSVDEVVSDEENAEQSSNDGNPLETVAGAVS
jgi:hypothetical protein